MRKSGTISTQKRKKTIRQKFGLAGTINSIQERWQARKIEEEADRLQKAADQNNMQPIWGFQRRLRTNTNAWNIEIKKTDGTEFHGAQETMKRWGEWESECFRKNKNQLTPK